MSETPATAEAIAQIITSFISTLKELPPETVTLASTFDELHMDSLDKINLSFEVEERFKINIPDDALNSLRTVGDVVAGVQRILAEKS